MTQTLPSIVPMLSYEDVARAADWLVEAFGFHESLRYEDSAGRATHVELRLGDGAVMLGNPSPQYESPKTHRERCEAAARWSETPFVVDGVRPTWRTSTRTSSGRGTRARGSSPRSKTRPSATATTASRISRATAGCSPSASAMSPR